MCIISDVMSSREVDKKNELRSIVDAINVKYKKVCLTPFVVRNGDEIFGILSDISSGYKVIKDLLMLSEELKVPLYVGAGIGFVNNEDLDNPHEVNGSAIWSAADALKLLKNEDRKIKIFTDIHKTFKLYIDSKTNIPFINLNFQIYFIFERILKRTNQQKDIVKRVEEADGKSYEEIGIDFGYQKNPQNNVTKILYRADYPLISGAEESLSSLLQYVQNHLEKNR